MNKDTIEGHWKELKGKVKERWGKMTNDRLDVTHGKQDQLKGEAQTAYGATKDEVEKQAKDFEEVNKS